MIRNQQGALAACPCEDAQGQMENSSIILLPAPEADLHLVRLSLPVGRLTKTVACSRRSLQTALK